MELCNWPSGQSDRGLHRLFITPRRQQLRTDTQLVSQILQKSNRHPAGVTFGIVQR